MDNWKKRVLLSGLAIVLAGLSLVFYQNAAPAVLNVKNYGAFGDGRPHPISASELTTRGWNGRYSPGDEWDTIAAQEAIRLAIPGQSIYFPAGTYLIFKKAINSERPYYANVGFKIRAGVNIYGDRNRTILKNGDKRWALQTRAVLVHNISDSTASTQTFLYNIIFDNITMRFIGGDDINSRLKNLLVEGCEFGDATIKYPDIDPDTWTFHVDAVTGKYKTFDISKLSQAARDEYLDNRYKPTQLDLYKVEGSTVRTTKFVRANSNQIGRGIYLYNTKNMKITENSFDGYFVTAINASGADYSSPIKLDIHPTAISPIDWATTFNTGSRNENLLIDTNSITRNAGSTYYLEDHGIYIWGAIGLKITKNTIRGWSLSDYGGSIKLRNSENIEIANNNLFGSGILTLGYSNGRPAYVKNMTIQDNIIDLNGSVSDSTSVVGQNRIGISYWRNFTPGTRPWATELGLVFRRNTIRNGSLAILKPSHADYTPADNVFNKQSYSQISVYDNIASRYIFEFDEISDYNNL